MFSNYRIQKLLLLSIFFLIGTIHAEQQVSIVCELGGGTQYELELSLNPNNIDLEEVKIMSGSYFGDVINSKIKKDDKFYDKMTIKGNELKQVTKCLNDKLSTIKLPTKFFKLPSWQINMPNIGNPQLAIQDITGINLNSLQNELATISNLFQQNKKKVAFHKLGKLTTTINNIKNDEKTVFQGKKELINHHNSIVKQYFEDGMLRCENNRPLIKLETPKRLQAGKVLRHIVNLLCIENMTWDQPFIAYVMLLDVSQPIPDSQIFNLFENAIYTSDHSKLSIHILSLLDKSVVFGYLKKNYINTNKINVRETLISHTIDMMFTKQQISQSDYKTTMREVLKQWLQ
ncbi:hypothetical protein QUF74_03580 [Candidatus Halobeggiatoa sp. HSG11]|nr:hypothetical protein [Candidatus Halobeggiatoa sp. HSG11]